MTQSSSSDKLVKFHPGYDAAHTATVARASDEVQTCVPSDAAVEYFDLLLGAVTARLKHAVDGAGTDAIATTAWDAFQRLRTTVLECVEALEQLQASQQ